MASPRIPVRAMIEPKPSTSLSRRLVDRFEHVPETPELRRQRLAQRGLVEVASSPGTLGPAAWTIAEIGPSPRSVFSTASPISRASVTSAAT